MNSKIKRTPFVPDIPTYMQNTESKTEMVTRIIMNDLTAKTELKQLKTNKKVEMEQEMY